MPLTFSDGQARYNPYTDVVTFFAMDGEVMVMCNVSRELLEYLEHASLVKDREILAAFAKHYGEIQLCATQQHRAQHRRVACALSKVHFIEHMGIDDA